MHDIDLIPADYHQLRQHRRWWLWSLAVMALLLLGTAGARAWLQRAMALEGPRMATLRAQASEAQVLQTELLALGQREAQLQTQAQALRALRRSPPWPTALMAVDQAYTPRLWLDQIQVLAPLPAPVSTPLPSAAAALVPVLAPAAARLEIKGHAADHATLSQFVQALGTQPGLAEVRLTQSGLHQAAGVDVVDFELRAALAHEGAP